MTHRSRVLPVVEPNPLLARYTAEIIDEPKDDAAEDQSDLEKGGDQLDLAVDADKEDVGQEREDWESAHHSETSGLARVKHIPIQIAIQTPGLRSLQ